MDNYHELSTYSQQNVVKLKKPTPLRPTPGIPLPIMPMTPPPPPPLSSLSSSSSSSTTTATTTTDFDYELFDKQITKQINDDLARSYIMHIESTFKYNKPEIYNEFIDLMKLYKLKKITFDYLRDKIKILFNNHPDLIIGFNTFLPEQYKIIIENKKIQELIPNIQPIITPGHLLNYHFDHNGAYKGVTSVPSTTYSTNYYNYDYNKQQTFIQSQFNSYVYSYNNNSAFSEPRYETISPDQSKIFYK